MNVKDGLKMVFGERLLSFAKGEVMHFMVNAQMLITHEDKMWYDTSKARMISVISQPGMNCFRGYYDIRYMSDNGETLLAHRVKKGMSQISDSAEVGYYTLYNNEFKRIGESKSWCWQQGSRLRWNPLDCSEVLFNDLDEGKYVTKQINIYKGSIQRIIGMPLYDVSRDFKWGLSLNFSRLQRMRPGYGYGCLPDKTEGIKQPEDDGLFNIDLEHDKGYLVYSIRDLAIYANLDPLSECYLNHISISPDSKNSIFFLIYTTPGVRGWEVILYLYNNDTGKISLLKRNDRVSHYCWIDSSNLLITCQRHDKTEYYETINIVSGKKELLNIEGLNLDGHPGMLDGTKFITDTYPIGNGIQALSIFDMEKRKMDVIARFYHDWRMRGEVRCDLHPSVEMEGKIIAVDSTFRGGKRSIVVLENKEMMEG